MAQPLCAPLAQSWIPGPARRPPLVPSDGDSVCSPAWYSDSWDASPRGCPLCPDGGPAQAQALGLHRSPAACSGVSWGSPPACPGPRVVAEPWDPSFLYAETEAASLERQEMEPSHSSPLFSSDVLALLETWTPQEWPPA
nr:mesoderm posterior protein 1 [Peromyscus maniculatus bairdii]